MIPQWIETEQQRIKRERWLSRIEGAMGAACVVVWVFIIFEAVRGWVR